MDTITTRRIAAGTALALSSVALVSIQAASPAGAIGAPTTVYVTNGASTTVVPINSVTDTPGTPITVGSGPQDLSLIHI